MENKGSTNYKSGILLVYIQGKICYFKRFIPCTYLFIIQLFKICFSLWAVGARTDVERLHNKLLKILLYVGEQVTSGITVFDENMNECVLSLWEEKKNDIRKSVSLYSNIVNVFLWN